MGNTHDDAWISDAMVRKAWTPQDTEAVAPRLQAGRERLNALVEIYNEMSAQGIDPGLTVFSMHVTAASRYDFGAMSWVLAAAVELLNSQSAMIDSLIKENS